MTGSTLARRSLGRRLRKLRDAAGIRQAAAARAAELSPQSIGRLEDGQATRISGLHINALCNAYGVHDDERRALLDLAAEAREVQRTGGAWWRPNGEPAHADVDHLAALEETARRWTSFQNVTIPILLQTADYRRACEWTLHPQDATADIEHRVETALQRRKRLHDNDFDIVVYLLQSVLHHPVGGPAVMARQLAHLHDLTHLPNISIRVIPRSADSHIGLHLDRFVLLEFGNLPATGLPEPPIIHVEGHTGSLFLERDCDLTPYRDALAELNRVALDEDRSRTLMLETAADHQP
ncbi:helix-turn-helix domain-containing protein [Nocardia vaccinii]|uniref:helix-turn-helix domain-containing protein n=1 Tax=Nocardia vaccinii TaxID=1822 RepID=UPI0008309D58|nr:helix-turn-helix transcriptional regulator [Nocardia vaccinii]